MAQLRRPGGLTPVFEEGLEVQIRDMSPVLGKAKAANPDVLLIHLHAGPTALLIRQAASMGLGIPIVAGSAMHQPSTAELLEPGELKGVCAESERVAGLRRQPGASSGSSSNTGRNSAREPDGFALGQYRRRHDGSRCGREGRAQRRRRSPRPGVAPSMRASP